MEAGENPARSRRRNPEYSRVIEATGKKAGKATREWEGKSEDLSEVQMIDRVVARLPSATERELAREFFMLSFRALLMGCFVLCGVTACSSDSDNVGGAGSAGTAASGGADAGSGGAPDNGGGGGGGGLASAEAGASGHDDGSLAEAGAAGASDSGDTCPSHFATGVVTFTKGDGPTTGQAQLPGIVLGPPKGGGVKSGSLDVATLGNGGSITLSFDPSSIVDKPGPDFIVFENPFDINGDPKQPFAELATVEVSEDGVTFHAYECTATAYPYGSCAGWHPVFANANTNHIDPTDPAVAGGDAFDLADLGLKEARFVRITDRPDQQGLSGTFDLDAVSIVHAACP